MIPTSAPKAAHKCLSAVLLALVACSGSAVVDAPDATTTTDAAAPSDAPDAPDACAAGAALCSGRCVNLASEPAHCGACGNACAAGAPCADGRCQMPCAAGERACGSTCVNVQNDNAHCGACGNACAAGQMCAMGRCELACAAPLTTCSADGDAGAGDAGVGRYCADTRSDERNCGACGAQCPAGNTCLDGVCAVTCVTSQTLCGATCRDLQTDVQHCGTCSNACFAGQVCSTGACQASCGAGLSECAGGCVSTASDPRNCGACGARCELPHASVNACAAGVCVVGACDAGFADCDGNPANGCEVEVRGADVNNCGACGLACRFANAGATCAAGVCALGACGPAFADCDGVAANGCESDLARDNAHCGRCSTSSSPTACQAGQVCSAGVCATTCGAGLSTCGGACTSTSFDPRHCGACGSACALANVATQACASGACVVGACAAGFADCDRAAANGCEVNIAASATNCGACGNACAAGRSCVSGACVVVCPAGQTNCADTCRSLATESNNCGACGRTCSAGATCVAGVCTVTCPAGRTACGDTCHDLSSDVAHCGACGNFCPLGYACLGDVCTAPCPGQVNNFTGCAASCAPGTACFRGACTAMQRTCAEVLAARSSATSGLYPLDVDGAGALAPFTAYCDMDYAGGGWTLFLNHRDNVLMCEGESTPGSRRYLPRAAAQALAALARQVHIRTAGRASDRSITSVPDALAIQNLRLGRVLNDGQGGTSMNVLDVWRPNGEITANNLTFDVLAPYSASDPLLNYPALYGSSTSATLQVGFATATAFVAYWESATRNETFEAYVR